MRRGSGRAGFLLPLAILGLLAVTALVLTSWVLVLGMLRDTTLERRYVEGWAAPLPDGSGEIAVGWELARYAGPRGLAEDEEAEPADPGTESSSVGRWSYRVVRVIDPPREARLWAAPVYAPSLMGPTDPPATGWAPPPCGGTEHRARTGPGPLLQFFGEMTDFLHPGGVEWAQHARIGTLDARGEALVALEGENGVGWLLSAGSVELEGVGVGRGILLSLGAVTLLGGAEWEGGVAAAGPVQVEPESRVTGSWCALEEALEVLPIPRRFTPRGITTLGRF